MFFRSKDSGINLLDLIPERQWSHTENDDGTVSVDMPRFHVAWMQRYLVPSGKHPYIRINLDRFGSLVWTYSDGTRTVGDIADALEERFGDEVRPVHDRLAKFMHQLRTRGFVRLRTAAGDFVK